MIAPRIIIDKYFQTSDYVNDVFNNLISNYNLDLDRIYLENTEPLYKECSDEEYNAFYTYNKTIYLLCAGNKPFIALTEYYRNQVTPQAVIFYDISKTSIEYYKEIFTSKELLLNQLPDSIDKQDFFDWFKLFNIDFVNKVKFKS